MTMAVNPTGFVCVADGGNPRIIGTKAIEAISGGQLCVVSGAADAISSGLNSFTQSDIWSVTGASGADFNGIAIANAAPMAKALPVARITYKKKRVPKNSTRYFFII